MNGQHLQAARIVAGTLTLLSREIREVGPPVDRWSPGLSPDFIRDAAAMVGRGDARPLWVDERHPARGLAIYHRSAWESEFLGFEAARLLGPFMVVEDQADREARVRHLAALAAGQGRLSGHRLITAKTLHDPAVLRGFLGEGFVLAEIGSSLTGRVPGEPLPAERPAGFMVLEDDDAREAATETVTAMGDFFYDGHWRNDQIPGPESARRLWSQIALEDLTGKADPAVILWDQRRERPAAFATVRPGGGPHAALSILAVAAPYRGRGLGRLIMHEILNRLIGRVAAIRVETASYNLSALKLYTSLGFVHTAPLAALHYHSPQ
jgi:ribosomal protein S18 acetylase RimI-like enzyme